MSRLKKLLRGYCWHCEDDNDLRECTCRYWKRERDLDVDISSTVLRDDCIVRGLEEKLKSHCNSKIWEQDINPLGGTPQYPT
jgi:hypothetical protein